MALFNWIFMTSSVCWRWELALQLGSNRFHQSGAGGRDQCETTHVDAHRHETSIRGKQGGRDDGRQTTPDGCCDLDADRHSGIAQASWELRGVKLRLQPVHRRVV